ncbi:MerR family transcriptional regulator [Rosenbergiella epipactidis]|uniref:MerR family transcriptional regulator n=1 Tax=Rosenbergiella epipactidis TaxID=1544694 RepID=UPI001F4E0BFA|nr:MerR family transcriptional regulator [Rosenbergiella epipactidis]
MGKELNIGEVVAVTGIKTSTLRFYEKKGLITFIGRNGLRRQYHQNVVDKLKLIKLGQAAGFTLSEMKGMLNIEHRTVIDRDRLSFRAKEIDSMVRIFRLLSKGIKHVLHCTELDHSHCEEFKEVIARGLRIIKKL